MENDEQFERTLSHLLRQAERAADGDAARVGLGLEGRIMGRIANLAAEESPVDQWARAFFRGAFGSLAVTAALAAVVWMGGYFAALENRVALSGLADGKATVQLWPTSW